MQADSDGLDGSFRKLSSSSTHLHSSGFKISNWRELWKLWELCVLWKNMEAWTKDNDNAVDIHIYIHQLKLKLKLKLTSDVTGIT